MWSGAPWGGAPWAGLAQQAVAAVVTPSAGGSSEVGASPGKPDWAPRSLWDLISLDSPLTLEEIRRRFPQPASSPVLPQPVQYPPLFAPHLAPFEDEAVELVDAIFALPDLSGPPSPSPPSPPPVVQASSPQSPAFMGEHASFIRDEQGRLSGMLKRGEHVSLIRDEKGRLSGMQKYKAGSPPVLAEHVAFVRDEQGRLSGMLKQKVG